MSGGVIIPDKETAKKLNELARHKQIVRLLADITADMTICELEGWDRMEYINQLKELMDSFGGEQMSKVNVCKNCPNCGADMRKRRAEQ